MAARYSHLAWIQMSRDEGGLGAVFLSIPACLISSSAASLRPCTIVALTFSDSSGNGLGDNLSC